MTEKRMLAGEPSAAEQELDDNERALREIACALSCGGFNDLGVTPFDPERYKAKILDSCVDLSTHNIVQQRAERAEHELQRLRAELAEAKAVAKSERKQERELRDGVRELADEYDRERARAAWSAMAPSDGHDRERARAAWSAIERVLGKLANDLRELL